MRIAMAQINSVVGDLEGNIEKIVEYIDEAKRHRADLVVFPELAVTGYPPQDLLREKAFVEGNKRKLDDIADANLGMAVVVGIRRPRQQRESV